MKKHKYLISFLYAKLMITLECVSCKGLFIQCTPNKVLIASERRALHNFFISSRAALTLTWSRYENIFETRENS